MTEIDLGFPEERDTLWLSNRYFPSKVGGKPAWLELELLPSKEHLVCANCQRPKAFLCQIYAPFDEEHNFHRTIFVFICRTPNCQKPNSAATLNVWRSQLPRKNKFYSEEPPEESGSPLGEIQAKKALCIACGCPGPLTCGRCKSINYCSSHHQRAHWYKCHKEVCRPGSEVKISFSETLLLEIVFPEWEIVIESNDQVERAESKTEPVDNKSADELNLREYEKLVLEGKTGTLKELPESELEKYVGCTNEVDDKYFRAFRKEVGKDPEQIVRYKRDGKPLWITEERTILSQLQIPNCENCGAERQFEFQLMPQMLLLLKDENLDWGILAIYTCSKSCQPPTSVGYLREYVIKQDIVLNNKK